MKLAKDEANVGEFACESSWFTPYCQMVACEFAVNPLMLNCSVTVGGLVLLGGTVPGLVLLTTSRSRCPLASRTA